ncbi:MAG: phosphatase [Paenibacillaceae bacterium]|nr:phosphatase [Paenibacillaceae bacterium]
MIPEWVDGIRVYRGAELNFTNFEGEIDLSSDTIINRLDYTIASFHDDVIPPGSVEDHTRAYLHSAENPLVDIIGHSGTACYEYDYERVIPEFGKNGKVVEINEGTFHVRKSSADNCRTIARLCMKYSVPVIVSSDAHFCRSVGVFEEALSLLNSLDFPEELVVNANMKQLESWFLHKRRVQ